MWNLPGLEIEPVSSALAGGFLFYYFLEGELTGIADELDLSCERKVKV